MKISLVGAHAKRMPLSYAAYKRFARQYFHFETPERADWLVFGFSKDIKDGYQSIVDIRRQNPAVKLIVLSEEPLWDTLWSGNYLQRKGSVKGGGSACEYSVLNHFTTDIYRFEKFPYFITTSDDYFVRYANLFRRNTRLTADEIKQVWRRASIRQAYFAEKHAAPTFDVSAYDHDVLSLCSVRTEIAELALGEGVLRVGKGWGTAVRRQALPDWHLDKLATLDRQAYIVSGIENTHQCDYITEKFFDAYAVLGIPLYVASPNHSVTRLVPEGAFINLHGLSPAEAVKYVHAFEPDAQFVAAYREAQARLATLFSSPADLWAERMRVIDRIVCELRSINDMFI